MSGSAEPQKCVVKSVASLCDSVMADNCNGCTLQCLSCMALATCLSIACTNRKPYATSKRKIHNLYKVSCVMLPVVPGTWFVSANNTSGCLSSPLFRPMPCRAKFCFQLHPKRMLHRTRHLENAPCNLIFVMYSSRSHLKNRDFGHGPRMKQIVLASPLSNTWVFLRLVLQEQEPTCAFRPLTHFSSTKITSLRCRSYMYIHTSSQIFRIKSCFRFICRIKSPRSFA